MCQPPPAAEPPAEVPSAEPLPPPEEANRGFLATHVPFIPDNPQHLNPWLAALANRNIHFILERTPEHPIIWVPKPSARWAREELDAYEAANAHWPRHAPRIFSRAPLFTLPGILGFLVFESLLFRFFLFVEQTPQRQAWKDLGCWDLDAISANGEWWRCLTALTLHADTNHVLSNMLWGGLYGALSAARLGTGLTLLLMLTSGVMGNAIMALLGSDPHRSLGASTMVFGLLGILIALPTFEAWKRREEGRGIIRLLPWIPLAFGIGMTALYGTAPGSDIMAHACGFLSGALLGLAAIPCRTLIASRAVQITAAALSLLAILGGWLAVWR